MRLAIFDVDGTLVDSQDLIVEAQKRAFAAWGLNPPDRARALSVVGLSLHEAFHALAGAQAPIAALAETYKEAFQNLRADPAYIEPLFAGARATVDRLARHENLLLGIATGKSRRGADYLLARENWRPAFATVQTADDHPSKPAPDMIHAALAETGVAPENAFMIGDTTYDMTMARAAGVRAIGVAWGYHPVEALQAAGANKIVADFGELAGLIMEPDLSV